MLFSPFPLIYNLTLKNIVHISLFLTFSDSCDNIHPVTSGDWYVCPMSAPGLLQATTSIFFLCYFPASSPAYAVHSSYLDDEQGGHYCCCILFGMNSPQASLQLLLIITEVCHHGWSGLEPAAHSLPSPLGPRVALAIRSPAEVTLPSPQVDVEDVFFLTLSCILLSGIDAALFPVFYNNFRKPVI